MKRKQNNSYHLKRLFLILLEARACRLLPDATYLKLKYRLMTGKTLNLNHPQTFNEKLQWLKLYDRKTIYTTMVDKCQAKEYVANIIGKEYTIPTLGIFSSFNDINFDKLPNRFVIKCTHDSGGIVICKDKSNFDKEKARKTINKCLRRNFFWAGREWPYKDIKPRIIVEEYMEDIKNKAMRDYKFFCFSGKPEIVYISEGSHTERQRIAFFDMNYEKLDIKRKDYGDFSSLPHKPKNWEKMKKFSSVLSESIPHLRVDWYEINGKLYFSELTFYTGSGFIPFEDQSWDRKLGDMIQQLDTAPSRDIGQKL